MARRLLPELDTSLLNAPTTPRPPSRGQAAIGSGRQTPLGTAGGGRQTPLGNVAMCNGLTPSTAASSGAASLTPATPRERPSTVSGATVGKLFGTAPRGSGADTPNKNKHLKYDKLRLREWFNAMDVDRSGSIQRQTFVRFLIDNPVLRDIICSIYASQHGEVPESCANSRAGSKDSTYFRAGSKDSTYNRAGSKESTYTGLGPKEDKVEQAKKYKRLIAAWKEIDTDKSGTLEWEEFVEYFRVNGFLLEYQLENNPKDRLTNLLTSMHDNPEDLDADEMEEFSALRGNHVDKRRSCTLGVIEASKILNTMTPAETEDPDNPTFVRRRSSLSKVAAGTGTGSRRASATVQLLAQDRGGARIATTPLF